MQAGRSRKILVMLNVINTKDEGCKMKQCIKRGSESMEEIFGWEEKFNDIWNKTQTEKNGRD